MSNLLTFDKHSITAIKEYPKHLWKNINRTKERKAMKKLILGLGVLAIAGTAAGIIIAMKIGKEGREDLKNKAVETIDTINDEVQREADMVKETAEQAAKDASEAIEAVNAKTENVKKDVDAGIKQVKIDIKKTARTIKKEIKKPVKAAS
jgi:gas vesicle protein